jgi:hypothetical protein
VGSDRDGRIPPHGSPRSAGGAAPPPSRPVPQAEVTPPPSASRRPVGGGW